MYVTWVRANEWDQNNDQPKQTIEDCAPAFGLTGIRGRPARPAAPHFRILQGVLACRLVSRAAWALIASRLVMGD